MPAPRTSAPSATSGSDVLLYLLFDLLGAALTLGSTAWLIGNLTNWAIGSDPWAPFAATDALLHPARLWPHLSPVAILVSTRVVPGLAAVCLAGAGFLLWNRQHAGAGLARRGDIAPLMAKESATKATALRPSLVDRSWKRGPAH